MALKRARSAVAAAHFRSASELREVLDAVMKAIDADPDARPRLRAAAAPLRFEFPDLKLWLTVSAAERGCLDWDFSHRRKNRSAPKLRLTMESDFANRLFQGRENAAIAIARGRLRTTVTDAGAVLNFFSAAKPLFSEYRRVVAERYPHLAID